MKLGGKARVHASGRGGTIYSFIFHAFFYILQPLLLGNSLYRGAVYNVLVLAVSSLRCPELPAFLARVAQNTAGRGGFRHGRPGQPPGAALFHKTWGAARALKKKIIWATKRFSAGPSAR